MYAPFLEKGTQYPRVHFEGEKSWNRPSHRASRLSKTVSRISGRSLLATGRSKISRRARRRTARLGLPNRDRLGVVHQIEFFVRRIRANTRSEGSGCFARSFCSSCYFTLDEVDLAVSDLFPEEPMPGHLVAIQCRVVQSADWVLVANSQPPCW